MVGNGGGGGSLTLRPMLAGYRFYDKRYSYCIARLAARMDACHYV